MSAQDTLGKLIDEKERRDAIHIAMAPVVAGCKLLPGDDIGFIESNQLTVGRRCDKCIGIADPFLKSPIKEGDRFWMLLYPNTISSLRHEWEHPAFLKEEPALPSSGGGERKATSISWIKDYADRLGISYTKLMGGAAGYAESGEYLCCGDILEGEYTDDNFWAHYEIATGEIVDVDKRNNFFSCSC